MNARTTRMTGDLFEFREIDLIRVDGKQEPEHVFEVVGRRDDLSPAMRSLLERFAEGLAAYRRRAWQEATTPSPGPGKPCPRTDPARSSSTG